MPKMRQLNLFFGGLGILLLIWPCKAYNYCYRGAEKELCNDEKHTMCQKEPIPREGDLVALVPMSQTVKDHILEKHNKCRDEVASGEAKNSGGTNFPKATRMRVLIWDEELAYIAAYHVSFCSFNHDKCRNTKRFKFAGQNLGYASSSKPKESIIEAFNSPFKAMCNEKDDVPDPDQMAQGFDGAVHMSTGHFTLIANDRVSRVGCAIAYCRGKSESHEYYFTCNYETNNIHGLPVYATGDEPASDCSFWDSKKDKKYKNLCANNGKIFPPNKK